jgi:RNA 2',3'-cyclic 3'-phosphodiesterase
MRLFTAIELPNEILIRLDRLLALLRPEALLKWSPLDNLHLTTKFIGEWPEARLEELVTALKEIPARQPFQAALKHLSWLPNETSPRALVLGVQSGEELPRLARETEARLSKMGIQKEERAFRPHVTLARIKSRVPLGGLHDKIDELEPASIGSLTVDAFCLYRSDPGSQGSLYRKLHSYRFESEAPATP